MKQQIYTLRQQKQQNINANNTKIPVLLMNLIHTLSKSLNWKPLVSVQFYVYNFSLLNKANESDTDSKWNNFKLWTVELLYCYSCEQFSLYCHYSQHGLTDNSVPNQFQILDWQWCEANFLQVFLERYIIYIKIFNHAFTSKGK